MNEKHKYENVRTHDAAPIAGSMIESLRDLGYTPETVSVRCHPVFWE